MSFDYRASVSVLRRLDQKDQQKRHDRRARVDDKLPSIAVTEQRACDGPDKHDGPRQDKGHGPLETREVATASRANQWTFGGDIADVELIGRFARIWMNALL